jgi:hypothetical protein
MNDDRYIRSVKELEKVGCKWWPKDVRDEAMKVSILQYLLDSQEKFISLLTLADKNKPEKLFNLLDASDFQYHLFLKHLALLTDVGSEPLQRFNTTFKELFPDNELEYVLGRKKYVYKFSVLPIKGKLDNERMQIDTKENLQVACKDKDLCKDLIMLLTYGSASSIEINRAILYKCNAYENLGEEDKIKQYVRENYIRVSRIIAGKTATDLGNYAQVYVLNYMRERLGDNYNLVNNGKIPGVKLDDDKEAPAIMEKVRNAIVNLNIEAPEGAPCRIVTISVGGTIVHDLKHFNFEESLAIADKNLYKSKNNGKNICSLDGSII